MGTKNASIQPDLFEHDEQRALPVPVPQKEQLAALVGACWSRSLHRANSAANAAPICLGAASRPSDAQSASRLLGAKALNSVAEEGATPSLGGAAPEPTASRPSRRPEPWGLPVPRSYRWDGDAVPRSRRPRRCRPPTVRPAVVKAVEELRTDHPMYGKRKLAVLLRREGIVVSPLSVGRIL